MALLTAENLSLGYESGAIIEGLNFKVDKGEYLCIVGENGSGKSTLMKTVLHLMEPLKGRVIYGDGLKRSEIGYLPQHTAVQKDFPASVREIVLSGCQGRCGLRPFYSREEKEIAWSNMERMGITDLRDRCYRELSGGQQQRVLLARALCAAGRMLFLDEPVAGLDPDAAQNMYETISDINKSGIAVMMISHDLGATKTYADRVIRIEKEVRYSAS
ncbi:MAG: metal ABC transporter ATP-binding protein [Clostridiales bacterium]|nr:metal ABC transporter ATP-binding protein [Clostridiales bacterium]